MLRVIEKLNLSLVIPPIVGLVVGFLTLQGLSKYLFILYIGFGFVFLSLVRPLQVLFVYIILFPLLSTFSISLGRGIPDLSFNRVGVMIILVAVLFRAFFGKTNLKSRSHAELWMLIFCLIASVSMFTNYDTEQFIQNMLVFMDSFVIPFILYFLAKNLFSKKEHVIQLTKILVIPAIYLSIMAIYEHFMLHDLFPAAYSLDSSQSVQGLRISASGILRVNGPFMYPETFGLVSAMILLILSYHIGLRNSLSNRHPLLNSISLLVLPLLAVGLFFSMFRGIWLGAIGGLVMRFAILKGQRLKIIISITLVALMMWTGSEMIKSTTVYKERVSNVETLYTRIATYKSGLGMFLDHPTIGIGYNNFTRTYERLNYSRTFRDGKSVKQAHNSYLKLLVENGIFGFTAYLFMIGSFLFYMIKLYRQGNGEKRTLAATFLGIFVAYLVPCFFFNVGVVGDINNLFYFFMGTLVAQFSNAVREP